MLVTSQGKGKKRGREEQTPVTPATEGKGKKKDEVVQKVGDLTSCGKPVFVDIFEKLSSSASHAPSLSDPEPTPYEVRVVFRSEGFSSLRVYELFEIRSLAAAIDNRDGVENLFVDER